MALTRPTKQSIRFALTVRIQQLEEENLELHGLNEVLIDDAAEFQLHREAAERLTTPTTTSIQASDKEHNTNEIYTKDAQTRDNRTSYSLRKAPKKRVVQ
jgi:hypothetical protein